jgi:hypothetical protein
MPSGNRRNEETEYDAAVFLSPPRSPKKRVSAAFGRISISDFGRRVSSSSPITTASTRQEKFRSVFSRKEDSESQDLDEEEEDTDDGPLDIGSLLSPQLEKKIVQRKSLFSPLKALRPPPRQSAKSKSMSALPAHRADADPDNSSSGEEESDASRDEEYDSGDEDVENLATEDDVLILLCREFELMTDDEEE